MRFTTEDGRDVDVGLCHTWTQIPRYPGVLVRETKMWLRSTEPNGDPIHIEETVICSPTDNFSRRVGRQMVREKFLPEFEFEGVEFNVDFNGAEVTTKNRKYLPPVKSFFSRNDRRRIYSVVYPEYQKRRRDSRRLASLCDELFRLQRFLIEGTSNLPAKPFEESAKAVGLDYEEWNRRVIDSVKRDVDSRCCVA